MKNKLLEEFFNREYDNLHKAAGAIVKDWEDAEDILQESILDIYSLKESRIKELLDKKVMVYFIIGIINNKNYNRFKAKYKFNVINEDNTIDNFFDSIPDFADEFEIRKEMEDREDYLLDNLDGILTSECTWFDREVFKRYHSDFNSFNKFAEKTKISKSTLYNAYIRARKVIRRHI